MHATPQEGTIPPEDLTTIASCELCGGRAFRPELTASPWTLDRCMGCGLVFTNPRFTDQRLGRFYTAEYYETGASTCFEMQLVPPRFDDFELARACRALVRKASQPRSIDVGCGPGRLVEAFGCSGFVAKGIEPSAMAAATAQSRNRDISNATVRDMPSAAFDVVTAMHVLEHVPTAKEFVGECARILAPGGILVIEVPNYGSRHARALGPRWPHLYPDSHLYQFTPATLRRLITGAGVRVLKDRWLGGGMGGSSGSPRHEGSIGGGQSAAARPPESAGQRLKQLAWESRRALFALPGVQTFVRYAYWHLLGRGEYIRIFATKDS
jgi:SAM-dependent methyltransferase